MEIKCGYWIEYTDEEKKRFLDSFDYGLGIFEVNPKSQAQKFIISLTGGKIEFHTADLNNHRDITKKAGLEDIDILGGGLLRHDRVSDRKHPIRLYLQLHDRSQSYGVFPTLPQIDSLVISAFGVKVEKVRMNSSQGGNGFESVYKNLCTKLFLEKFKERVK